MSSSAVWRFTDPDQYAASVQGAGLAVSVTKAGRFGAKLVRSNLGQQLWMQRFCESLPRIAHIDTVPDRVVISFSTASTPCGEFDGIEMSADTLILFGTGVSAVSRTSGPACFASMSLPIESMEALDAGFDGGVVKPPRDSVIVAPPAATMARLQKLHATAGHLTEHAPEVLACPAAARSLELALIAAMTDCLHTTNYQKPARRNRRYGTIIRRFYDLLRANPDDVLHIPEICKAIGVSRRTLSTCCNEILGMSPYHYLKLRQMNLARGALTRGDAAVSSVTQIATAHGFWDLGRFAVSYRAMFGERPSQTLRRAPGADPIGFVDDLFWRSADFT